jgi:hypothetical protein
MLLPLQPQLLLLVTCFESRAAALVRELQVCVYIYIYISLIHTALNVLLAVYSLTHHAISLARIANRCCSRNSCTDVSILQWLCSQRPEWFNSVDGSDHLANKTALLSMASEYCNFAVSQWLRCELNAEWPAIEGIICNEDDCTIIPDWPAEAVVWALDNGLEFEFDCSKLDPEKQPRFSVRKQEQAPLHMYQCSLVLAVPVLTQVVAAVAAVAAAAVAAVAAAAAAAAAAYKSSQQ